METPIYQQLSEERSIDVPAQPDPAPDAIQAAPALKWTHAPPDDDDAGLAGHLGTVTDDEWQAAHERLIAEHPELAEQLAYTWAPDVDGRTLIGEDEVDIAHREGRYDPSRDERFQGGGFHG